MTVDEDGNGLVARTILESLRDGVMCPTPGPHVLRRAAEYELLHSYYVD